MAGRKPLGERFRQILDGVSGVEGPKRRREGQRALPHPTDGVTAGAVRLREALTALCAPLLRGGGVNRRAGKDDEEKGAAHDHTLSAARVIFKACKPATTKVCRWPSSSLSDTYSPGANA